MGLGDFWLQSNNGKKISLNNLKELKKSDLENNPELMKLFDFFNTNKSNGSEEVLDRQELNSLFNTFSKTAQSSKGKDSSIFETEEAEEFINSNQALQELNIKAPDLFNFLSKIVKQQNEQKTVSESNKKTKTNQEVKTNVIKSLRADSDETLKIISNMNNGDISDIYDSVKTFLNMDTSKAKVIEATVNQAQGAKYMEQAENGELTREEYIKANKQRLQDMMKARLYKKDKNGIDYLDKNRADLKMSRKEFETLMLATIERMTDDMDIKSVKEKMRQLPMTTENGDRFLLDSVKQNAIVLFGKAKTAGYSTLDSATKYIYDVTKIVKPNPDDKKLLTFNEVFYYEQGVTYSKENCEKYLEVQAQLTKNLSSYNKYLEFKTGADKILKEKDAEKALNSVIKLFEQFYSDSAYPNLAYKNLKSVVKNSNLPINVTQDETGKISISMVSGSEDLLLSYVSDILTAESNIQQERLDKVFGGNTEEKLENMQKEVEIAHEKAYGNDFSSVLGKAMIEDNQTFIQRYTGNTSMIGMGLTVVGGVLCFTPAAALGAAMVTVGNTLAIGGMVSETVLGFEEAFTRKHGAEDGEYEELTKTMLMNLGGFGFGGVASKTGMKLFNRFVSKELESLPKLSEAFKTAMVKGNRAEALKIICSQPEYRKQFAKGLASKLISDFSISYAGDLVMMGVLNTQDDWESLLQANLIGILAGMGGDIKDAAHLGMKGDRYRALRQKEWINELTVKESEELATLRNDPDIKQVYPDDEITNKTVKQNSDNVDDIQTKSNLMHKEYPDIPNLDNLVSGENGVWWMSDLQKRAKSKIYQEEAELYLDKLLEQVQPAESTKGKPIKIEVDYMLSDGTIISRKRCMNEKAQFNERGWPIENGLVTPTKDEIVFWIKDTDGKEHIIPALNKENYEKAQKIFDYICTLEEIPFHKIDEAQQAHLRKLNELVENEKTGAKTKPLDIKISELDMTEQDSQKLAITIQELQEAINKLHETNPKKAEKLQKQLNNKVKGVNEGTGMKERNIKIDENERINSKSDEKKQQKAPLSSLDVKMTIAELLRMPEIQNVLGLEIEVTYTSGKKAKITIKEKLLKLAKQDKNCMKSINYVIKMAKKVENEQRIQTQELIDIQNKFCSTKLNDVLFDIECTLHSVKDNKIQDFVQKELSNIKTNVEKPEEATERLKNIQLVIDAYNVAEGHYTYIGNKSNISEYPEYRRYLDMVNKRYRKDIADKMHQYPTFKEKYINAPDDYNLGQKIDVLSDYRKDSAELQKNIRYTKLKEFCAKNPDSELSIHLYKEYYLKQASVPKKIQRMCLNICEKYNVKIFLPKECKKAEQAINYIEQELSAFSEAMEGSGDKLRHVIDIGNEKSDFLSGAAGGFIWSFDKNTVHLPSLNIEDIQSTLRHELIHTFDTKFGVSIDDIDRTKCDRELRNAGIVEQKHIDYAYTNSKELVAVAAEGDMNSYSEGFKSVLISKGMPVWAFKLKTLNPQILKNRKTQVTKSETLSTERTTITGDKEFSQTQDRKVRQTDTRYEKPISPYTELGNKIFEVKPDDAIDNPAHIAELRAEIENLRKTDPQKADELQIVLDMFVYPTKVQDVTDKQIDAVVNYLNDHYDHLEGYLTEQVGQIGISDTKIGRFEHRIKGEWSTRDKIANFIKDAISDEAEAKKKGETYTTKTLLDAFKDVRDKYACRTVFEIGDFANHPDVKILIAQAKTLAKEGKTELAAAKMREAEFKAAELQSEPVRLQILEAMRKAKQEGKDLTAVRISNYYSENGIPIFTPEQMHELKLEASEMGIDVAFIRLAKEIDPRATTEFVEGASTKQQPSGYTALQINFETKTGEVIEWQYRGELVSEFAEAEHLPYDLRTGKHPWAQYPELEVLYKPIAELIDEKVMPKHAYKQLNRYFTDYYTHLRRLELGFESEEPRLEEYENYKAKDENGVEQRYTYKFDSRLEAKNLMELHHFAEGIKDGLIIPERAVEEFNMKVFNQTKIKNSEKLSYEQRIKNLANQVKEAVGKDFSLDLSAIKDEDLLSFLEEELIEWDDPEPISNIINLAKNLELFQKGGFEALDEKAQKAYEIPYYWGASIKDRLTEARKTEDTKQREKTLAGIKMHIYSHILITSEVSDNIQFRNLVKEKFIQPNIPKEYYNAINELEELTGKQVCMIHDFGPQKDGIINLRIDDIEAWLSMSDKVKNFYKKNADKLLVEYNMLSKYLVEEYEKLSESELEVYVKRGGIDYQHSAGETPKEIVTMDEGKLNRIKKLSQRWKTSEGLQYSTSQICKLLEEFSTEEIEIIEKRQLYNLHTEIYSYLEPKYLRILTNLNEQEWQYFHNKGFISSDNELQLPFIKIENDHSGNMQRHDKTLEQFMSSINNLKNGSKIAENIQELGYSPLEALAQVGSLIKGINETEVKELQEFNWNAALTKYNNISKMMKANPEKYISGQFLSIKSIYELFSKEVLSQKYEYKKDIQNAVRNFFYENDIAHCEFYSDFQQKLSQEIRSNTIDVKQAKEILKSFFEKKVFSEEMSKDTSMPEKIMSDAVNEFLNLNEKRLTRLCAFMDKEGLETLLRKRFSDVEEYLDTLDEFNYADLKLLKDLSCSYNLSGKPFLPTQKIEFIDLISGYRAFGLDMSKMHQMVKEQKVDTAKLHKDLFMQIMKKIGMSDEEVNSIPNEKLMTWDLKYMHLLAKEIAGDFVNLDDTMHRSTKAGDNAFADIIRNANLNDFKLFIQDRKNIYGQTNAKTKDEYKENGLNYDIWVNPPQELNVHFESTDKDTKILINLSSKLLKDINILRQNNALKGIIDKQFSQCIKDGEFIIPSECQTSAVKLKGFIDNLLKTLESVKTRALSNLNNPQRSEIARRNLSTIQSIESTMINTESYKDLKASKSYNLTIKMWDRNPQHDLFQGNYSTCCIGMGGGNGSAQPHYLLNTSCNMIEIIDDATGKTVGNALCYFAKNAEGKPIFILDNVEINNSIKFTEETGKSFRNVIIQYADNIFKAVSGQENTEIYMGASYNDIPTSDLPVYNNKISFIGKLDCEELYLDVYSGWINTNELDGQRKLLRLK